MPPFHITDHWAKKAAKLCLYPALVAFRGKNTFAKEAILTIEASARPDASVPEGMRIYAVGDIHGRLDLLDRLLDLIQSDSEARGAARTHLVFLGDYVDRGSDSKGVVSRLISEPPPGFTRLCLKGNHEAMLLAFLDEPGAGVNWLHNGGNETLLSYGVEHRHYAGRIFPGARRAG